MQKVSIILLASLLLTSTACVPEARETAANKAGGPEALLLKDFRPESIFNIPVNRVEKARYPVIDMHAHTYARSEAELGMPVNIHVAEPKWMYGKMDSTNDGLMNAYKWRLDDKPDIVDHQGMIDILERTVQNHPNTTFIACHVANCGYDLSIIARLLDAYQNLHVDIGARFAEICATPRATAAFLVKYQDRIVYGTDMGRSPDMYEITFRLLETADEHIYDDRFGYHWPLHGLDLPDQVLEKIYRLNALRILSN
jgi:predicted TIM-barrel fold metal-dependent hydrolase